MSTSGRRPSRALRGTMVEAREQLEHVARERARLDARLEGGRLRVDVGLVVFAHVRADYTSARAGAPSG
ncbi:MAG: hypothetical protein M5U28_52905 [Sandaracinaceae bacterium]|nr:hypothetical protein [Sandaracinaceae bacterium]